MQPKELDIHQRKRIFGELIERFGFPRGFFEGFDFYLSEDIVYFCTKGGIKKAGAAPNIQDLGIGFCRLGANVKPTTDLIQMFGKLANKNIICLKEEQAKRFCQGLDCELGEEQVKSASNGFVIVRLNEDNLGCGFLRDKLLKSLVPGGKRLRIE